MRRPLDTLVRGLACALVSAVPSAAQPPSPAWVAEATAAGRFSAVHGERATVMGYPDTGLEVWAWPLQLLSGHRVRFREAGRVEPLDGASLLSRVESTPSEVVRVYVGPDFVVRERLFVPLHAPGAILTYEVEGRGEVQVEARFQPSLDLQWPGALGGQSVGWDAARSGYVEREPLHGFEATIRSPDAVAHDAVDNLARARPDGLALVMTPRQEADGVRRARLFVSQDGPRAAFDRADEVKLEIVTPDAEVNRALAAAVSALDRAWVCAPDLGCGEVAGYGPSRPGRRPQYAWFFAGDGLVAVDGLLAAGLVDRARDELAFIARRQDKATGMVWHELSLSAPLIDWERRYPYMFVHVDITLQHLATLDRYVETTGDRAFLQAQWPGVEAAWRYARSLVDLATALPAIPKGKQGQNEQDELRDDVRLSASWIEAADGFARLARAAGRPGPAAEAERAAAAAREAVRAHGWDEAAGFWLGGHTAAGAPVHAPRSDAAGLLLQGVFTPGRVEAALDRLSRPDFQTDWGVRNLSAAAPRFDPNSYGEGAVWALGTSAVATTLWRAHRPLSAWSAWRSLVGWSTLDSPGHMHEALAGDLFHPERESVPEQTWSSAGFLTAAVQGLLGLELHAATRSLTFAPRLPADWSGVGVHRLRLGDARLDLDLRQDGGSAVLEVRNDGAPVALTFAPAVPLGARLLEARVDGASVLVALDVHPQEQAARLTFTAGRGVTRVAVRHTGGVRLAAAATPPRPGDGDVHPKVVSGAWVDGALRIRAYADREPASLDLLTSLRVVDAKGADVAPAGPGRLRVTLRPPGDRRPGRGYAPVEAVLSFGGEAG